MKEEDIQLGFGDPPIPTYIYVGDSGDPNAPWYEVDYKLDKKIPILQTALTGKLIGLKMVKKNTKKGDVVKLDISFQADKRYVIRSGVETYFTRSFLLAAEKMDMLDELVTLVAIKGNDQSVVFCKLYYAINHEGIKSDWDPKIKLLPKINALQTRMNIHPQTYDEVMAGAVHSDTDDDLSPVDRMIAEDPIPPSTPPAQEAPPPEPKPEPPEPAEQPIEPAVEPVSEPELAAAKEVVKQEPVQPEAKVEVPASEREPAPIALARRTMGVEYYATQIDDLITVKQLGQLRALVEKLGKTEDIFSLEVMGSEASDLSVKGAEYLIHFGEVKVKELKTTKK